MCISYLLLYAYGVCLFHVCPSIQLTMYKQAFPNCTNETIVHVEVLLHKRNIIYAQFPDFPAKIIVEE